MKKPKKDQKDSYKIWKDVLENIEKLQEQQAKAPAESLSAEDQKALTEAVEKQAADVTRQLAAVLPDKDFLNHLAPQLSQFVFTDEALSSKEIDKLPAHLISFIPLEKWTRIEPAALRRLTVSQMEELRDEQWKTLHVAVLEVRQMHALPLEKLTQEQLESLSTAHLRALGKGQMRGTAALTLLQHAEPLLRQELLLHVEEDELLPLLLQAPPKEALGFYTLLDLSLRKQVCSEALQKHLKALAKPGTVALNEAEVAALKEIFSS